MHKQRAIDILQKLIKDLKRVIFLEDLVERVEQAEWEDKFFLKLFKQWDEWTTNLCEDFLQTFVHYMFVAAINTNRITVTVVVRRYRDDGEEEQNVALKLADMYNGVSEPGVVSYGIAYVVPSNTINKELYPGYSEAADETFKERYNDIAVYIRSGS